MLFNESTVKSYDTQIIIMVKQRLEPLTAEKGLRVVSHYTEDLVTLFHEL